MLLRAQEFKEASKGKGQEIGITLTPLNDNIFVWKALLVVSSPADEGRGMWVDMIKAPPAWPSLHCQQQAE